MQQKQKHRYSHLSAQEANISWFKTLDIFVKSRAMKQSVLTVLTCQLLPHHLCLAASPHDLQLLPVCCL